jgi:hypothetical protein
MIKENPPARSLLSGQAGELVDFNGYLVTKDVCAFFPRHRQCWFFGMPTITVDKPTFRMFALKINMKKEIHFYSISFLHFFSPSFSPKGSVSRLSVNAEIKTIQLWLANEL